MKMIHRGEKGFILIELWIVIAILGIIAALIIPNQIGTFMTMGTVSAANSEAENVKTGRWLIMPTCSSDQMIPNPPLVTTFSPTTMLKHLRLSITSTMTDSLVALVIPPLIPLTPGECVPNITVSPGEIQDTGIGHVQWMRGEE
jgi:hypothetical protein